MARYAEGTKTPVSSSQIELMKLMEGRGIEQHMLANDSSGAATLLFKRQGILYKIGIAMPDPKDREFTRDRYGVARPAADAESRYQAEVRRRWRSLLLVIKSKLVGVDDHVVESFEHEFLPYAVADSEYRTVADKMVPELRRTAALGSLPTMPALGMRSGS